MKFDNTGKIFFNHYSTFNILHFYMYQNIIRFESRFRLKYEIRGKNIK